MAEFPTTKFVEDGPPLLLRTATIQALKMLRAARTTASAQLHRSLVIQLEGPQWAVSDAVSFAVNYLARRAAACPLRALLFK